MKGHNVETAAVSLYELAAEADFRAKTVGYHCDKIHDATYHGGEVEIYAKGSWKVQTYGR